MNQLIAHNIIPQIFSRGFFFIVTVITTAIIARDLGPEKYGYYTIIFVYLTFVAVLTDLGLQTITVRESARYDERASAIVGTFCWIKIFLCLIIFSASIIILFLSDIHKVIKTGFVIALAGQFFVALSSIPNTIFQSKLKIKYTAISEIIGQSVFLASVIIVFFIPLLDDNLFSYIIVGVVSSGITFFVGMYFATKIQKIFLNFDKTTYKTLISETLPLSLIIILSQLHFRGDSFLLSLLKPERDMGIYGLSFKFFEASLIIPIIISTVVLPLMSKQSTNEKINEIASKFFNILLLLGLFVCLFIFFFSSDVIRLIGGLGFEDAAIPTQILGLAILFGYLNNLFVNIIIVKNLQRNIVVVSIVGVSINLVLNLLFIPSYSYKACAIIKVFTEFLGMVLTGYLAYKATKFIPFSNMSKKGKN